MTSLSFDQYLMKDFASSEMQALLKQLGFNGELKNEEGEPEAYATIPERGVDLLFKDEAYIKNLKRRNIGDGPFLLTAIFFSSGDDPDYKRYAGELPRGLKWTMTRDQALELLGKPDESPANGKDRWHAPNHRLIVRYSAEGKAITDVSVQLPPS
jgi:hypothetical protein